MSRKQTNKPPQSPAVKQPGTGQTDFTGGNAAWIGIDRLDKPGMAALLDLGRAADSYRGCQAAN
jgi:hypothetical protein